MRAARFLTCRNPETSHTDTFALFEMLGDHADEITEQGFAGLSS